MQEGNCNYGSPANARGASWFGSGCSLKVPRSLVSSHASQARRSMEKRALAATSGGLQASGCCSVSHMQKCDCIPCPGHASPLGGVPSLLRASQPLGECNRCNWPA